MLNLNAVNLLRFLCENYSSIYFLTEINPFFWVTVSLGDMCFHFKVISLQQKEASLSDVQTIWKVQEIFSESLLD